MAHEATCSLEDLASRLVSPRHIEAIARNAGASAVYGNGTKSTAMAKIKQRSPHRGFLICQRTRRVPSNAEPSSFPSTGHTREFANATVAASVGLNTVPKGALAL